MKLTRLAGLLAVALTVGSVAAYAAGNYSTLPVVEGGSFCASTVTGTGNLGGVTGQGQGTIGSICAQTVPAGPTAVTGYESIPADTGNGLNGQNLAANGGGPSTVTLQMANLNALPLTVSTVPTSTLSTLVATNVTGGFIVHNASSQITAVTVDLPAAPVDGQQFALSADQVITTLLVTSPTAGVTISKSPTVLTPSTTGTYGYRFMYNAALTNWFRLN